MEATRSVTLKTNSSFSAAQRRGDHIETHKRWAAGQNKQRAVNNTAKLADDPEDFHGDVVDMDVGRIIMQARQQKEWTQKDLATRINEKPQVVADYEQARAVRNQAILSKMERALGVKLRGKDKGKPLGGPKKN